MRAGVVTPKDTLHADVIVLAAALGIPELTEPLGLPVPLTAKPRTVTVITKPLQPVLKHIVVNGEVPSHLHVAFVTATPSDSSAATILCLKS